MSDHVLSQEEVDALLKAGAGGNDPVLPDVTVLADFYEGLLQQLERIVSPIAGKQFEGGAVTAELLTWEEVRQPLMSPLTAVWDFEDALPGMLLSIADGSSQQQLRAHLAEEQPATVLNKLALGLAAGLEKELGLDRMPQIASYKAVDLHDSEAIPWRSDDTCVMLQLSLRGEAGDVTWLEVLPLDTATEIIDRLGDVAAEAETTATAETAAAAEPAVAEPAPQTPEPAAPSAPPAAAAPTPVSAPTEPVAVAPAQFAPLGSQQAQGDAANIGLIMDVPLHVTVELGRRRMLVRDVLELGKGSLIELDKLAGEPVDVFVNGKLIAKGEVVVIDENFGVKVTNIVSPVERVQNLQ